jgi:spermidine/putrescine transport system permease protein
MAILPVVIIGLLCILPLTVVVWQSFVVWDDLRPMGWGTLHGYREILQPQRMAIIRELVLRAAIVACIDIAVAVPLAEFIVRRRSSHWRWALLLSLNVPFLISASARAFGWFHLFNNQGIIARILNSLVPGTPPIDWLIYTRTSVVITLVATTLAFAVFPIALALPGHADTIWAASEEMDVGAFTKLRRLVLPLGAPGVFVGWFCAFWMAFGSSVEASVVDGPQERSLGQVINQLRSANEFSAAYALSSFIVLAFIVFAVFLFFVSRGGLLLSQWQAVQRQRAYEALAITPKQAQQSGRPSWSMLNRHNGMRVVSGLLAGIVIFVFLFAPVWSILLLSLSPNSSQGHFRFIDATWYLKAFASDTVREAWRNTLTIAFWTGITSAAIATILGLSWWGGRWRILVSCGLIVLALLPPDAYSLGLLVVYQGLGFKGASLWLVWASDIALALPYCTAVVFAVNSSVDVTLFAASMEFGASRSVLFHRVILGLTWPGMVSAFIVGFLLSMNDYTRASYLSGSNQMLSLYVYGQMKSGADPSVYAIGGINVMVSLALFLSVLGLLKLAQRRISLPSA